jgi:tetratricopeptide (TPR) repeat protein
MVVLRENGDMSGAAHRLTDGHAFWLDLLAIQVAQRTPGRERRPKGPDLLELHPLVRNFVRQSFPQKDRASYIGQIIRVYKGTIGRIKHRLTERPPLSVLLYWTQNAELDIVVGNISDAFTTLMEVSGAFLMSAYPRELARVTRLLFSGVDWVSEHAKFAPFESVFHSHIRILSQLGKTMEVDSLLDEYERTVPNRDVRYIRYCELRCYSLWFRSEFAEAVEWGEKGQALVESSGVDSKLSAGMTHTLALAERDAGRPELALPIFLDGRALAEVIDPDELDEKRGEHHYGNIGRCLHFMGQIDSALVCYQKSALLIERSQATVNVTNKAYSRTWIGELLAGRGELTLAYAFLRNAFRLWEQVAPPKALTVSRQIMDIEARAGSPFQIKDREIDKVCLEWILGGDVEFGASTICNK